ncbi:MAG TPA: sigma-70 family RNA polymerase sigma factor [Blastocatellia bacterium]|nr:sigma-70 family RNA polymerase sigma factor [Blastocatellia bacterium]HMX25995.1 sigma-70 family RNA polymerase sigma factor [Blastocatellia bacterium]HMZ17951.1 sigma-70 family RNA polymerase sigma factor [Blastocatellia bacterium]HNG34910.1 sigma-70 family RNA polymerase sigma factor [Blastocatellia bacterium]
MSAQQTPNEFETIAMPHMNDLYRTARRTLGNQTEAEDVVQEAYLQAWKSFHRFEPGTNIRAWLFKILFHVINHHRRKTYRLVTLKEEEEFLFEQMTYEPPVAPELRDEDILAALDRVPMNFRAVILLADVQEFSYKEVAATLDIPIGTVMSRLNRGRQMLRGHLTKFAPVAKANRYEALAA